MENISSLDDVNKLKNLRELMNKYNYDAYIIPHSDTHDVIILK
jgi:hypothetical protein